MTLFETRVDDVISPLTKALTKLSSVRDNFAKKAEYHAYKLSESSQEVAKATKFIDKLNTLLSD